MSTAATAGNISCKQFTDFLIRRIEHLDEQLIKDVTPTDGWIGHVATGMFPALDGTTHTFDRINRIFPDLSSCWEDVTAGSCLGTPCDPAEKLIGFGSTRDSYSLQRAAYASQLFCFDLIMSADRAKEQFAAYIESLRSATNIIWSHRFRSEAFRGAGTKIAAGAGMLPFTFTHNADCTQIVPTKLPTSKLTIQMLQRLVQPLMLNGYLGAVPGMPPMFELVTDLETAWGLREGNSQLAALYRFEDFAKGGNLFKYGITDAIGNFGIRNDLFSLRYQLLADGRTLQLVLPYTNVAATQGIKGIVNPAFVNARYQVDFIWNRMAMKSLLRDTAVINKEMPFAARDFGGKWQFVMDNLGADSEGCVIENTRRNKGKFIADFAAATKYERPEWVVAILSLREGACPVDVLPCSADPGYVTQNYSSANAVCPNPQLSLAITGPGPYNITALNCNGVSVRTDVPSGALADINAVVAYLNLHFANFGTWSAVGNASPILLDGSTCNTITLTV